MNLFDDSHNSSSPCNNGRINPPPNPKEKERRRKGLYHAELERKTDERTIGNLAQGMIQKLNSLDDDFKKHHYSIIDAIEEDDEDSLQKEQEELNLHDDHIADFSMRLDQLATSCNLTADSSTRKASTRRLLHMKDVLTEIKTTVQNLTADSAEILLLHHCEEQLFEYKGTLSEIRRTLLSLELTEGDES